MAYIEKETLKEELLSNAVRLNDTKNMSTEDVFFIIDKQPDADVVEVVRCSECKYFKEYSDAHQRAVERADGDCYFKGMYCYDKQFIACRYNDFCSYGERKENE